jgi:hypothetical protein
MCYNVTFEVRSCNLCCSGKVMRITYSEGVLVALGIHRAMRMRHGVICSLPGSTLFFTSSHKRHDFRKKKILNIKMCFNFRYFYLKFFSF